MSTIVCQNLVSCETTTTMKLKVAPPTPVHPSAIDLAFLQSIPKETSSYTHPLAKKSSFSRLSAKSLELCTENIGSESGSDIITDDITIFQFNMDYKKSDRKMKSPKYPVDEEAKSSRQIRNFPPPLTTMSGSSALLVRRHREGGRLIIEAVEAPLRSSYLQAERRDGRLRLCFLRGGEEEDEQDECGGEMEHSDEPITEEEHDGFVREEFEGEMKVEMEIENFQRLRRCSGNQGLCCNWKPAALWVASS